MVCDFERGEEGKKGGREEGIVYLFIFLFLFF